jgi:hypothetical protein
MFIDYCKTRREGYDFCVPEWAEINNIHCETSETRTLFLGITRLARYSLPATGGWWRGRPPTKVIFTSKAGACGGGSIAKTGALQASAHAVPNNHYYKLFQPTHHPPGAC